METTYDRIFSTPTTQTLTLTPVTPVAVSPGPLYTITVDGGTWLLDTGSPISIGRQPALHLAGQTFPLNATWMGLTTDQLAALIQPDLTGLIGTDILNRFDWVLDVAARQIHVAPDALTCAGDPVAIRNCLGCPIVQATVQQTPTQLIFDTGASLSYFQGTLTACPDAGFAADVHPCLGAFTTDTVRAPLILGSTQDTLRWGRLPDSHSRWFPPGIDGIVGNELLEGRVVGYFPRREQLVIGAKAGS